MASNHQATIAYYQKRLRELEADMAAMSSDEEVDPPEPLPRLARAPADPEAFIERHRERSRAYYRRKAASTVTLPKLQCEFVNKITGIRCPTMVKCRYGPDGTTALRGYCSAHKYREKADMKVAMTASMINLD